MVYPLGKFNLVLNVYDFTLALSYQYMPQYPNTNERRCYILVDGNHVYTIDKTDKSLERKQLYIMNMEEFVANPPPSNCYQ